MMHTLKVYAAVLPVFLIIDFLWLGVIMSKFYKDELGVLARISNGALTPVIWAAGIVYVLIPLGIVLFALPKVSPDNMASSALFWGFVYGIVLYGVYDMTNYSLVSKWSLRMSIVDILWGGTINAIVTYVAAILNRWIA
ncbi:MAG: DUF2177 family protein [Nitrospiraceae bacterium]|nr:MAG: DUF2177 family protein [Nitrospiraceae bacterium]